MINSNFAVSLERNRQILNSAFEYYSSGDSTVDSSDVLNIFTDIVNPLFEDGFAVPDQIVISIFRSILKLTSRGLIGKKGRFQNLEKHLYSIAGYHKKLLSDNGGLFLINIYNALLNLHEKSILSIDKWVSAICSVSPDIDMETLRKTGFVLAWRSGAASGRENAAELIPLLDREILKNIFEIRDIDDSSVKKLYEAIINEPWIDPVSVALNKSESSPVLRTAGGFSGFGKEFRSIPAAAAIDDVIYVTDGTDVFRMYADYYGIELISDNEIKPESIRPGGVINRFVKEGNFILNNRGYPLPPEWKSGITSIAISRQSVVWTLRDSYKLYIAGLRGSNG